MSVNNRIGNRIAELRRAAGMSQDQLAEKLGITFQAVSKWENGMSCPDIQLLPELADIFNISIDRLFGRDAEAFAEQAEARSTDPQIIDDTLPNDDVLRVKIFLGKKMLKAEQLDELARRIVFEYDGDISSLHSELSVVCENVNGAVTAMGSVTCENITGGDITVGGDLICEDIVNVSGDIVVGRQLTAENISDVGEGFSVGGDIVCENIFDIGGDIAVGKSITCEDMDCGDITAGGDINCGDIDCDDVTAGRDINCSEINGNVCASGDVNSGDINGNVTAEKNVNCGDIDGDVRAGHDVIY